MLASIPYLLLRLLIAGLKILFSYATKRTGPIVRQLLKGSSCSDIMLGVTHFRVVHPATYGTSILLHGATDF